MPIDPNIYIDFIKNRMTEEQAKELVQKMDGMEKRRFYSSISLLSMPIIVLLFLTVIRLLR